MACAAKSLVNCVSMSKTGCFVSSPTFFGSSITPYPQAHLSIITRPINTQLSCSYTPFRSFPSLGLLKKQGPFMRVAFIAAQQEGKNPAFLHDQESEGSFNWGEPGSEDEGQSSDGTAEPLGDADENDDEYVEPPEEAKIYVGNLSYDVDSEKLAKLFEQAGVVEIAEVIYNRETDRSRGFGFVTMSTVEEGEKAVEIFNGYEWNGRSLTVNKASPKGSRLPPRASARTERIYVGNLPWSISDDRLEQIFSEHGKVVSAQVILDRETRRSRGFGFVVMSSASETNDAIANLDGQNLDGRAIRVNVAQERPRRGAF